MKTSTRIAFGTFAALLLTVCTTAAEAQSRGQQSRDGSTPAATLRVSPTQAVQFQGPQVIGTQPAPTGTPTLAQLGSSSAYVPMKHGSASPHSSTHVLAVQNGNLRMRFKAGMTCPKGRTVTHFSAKPAGVNASTIINGNTGDQNYSANITLKPFKKSELESTCQTALGGAWAEPGHHNNTEPTVKKTISKKIDVWGQCSGWANKVKRTYTALLTLTCEDTSWFVPEG